MFFNNSSHELNDSNRRIVGVFPSSNGAFPFIYYEDDFQEISTVANSGKVEYTYPKNENSSGAGKKYNGLSRETKKKELLWILEN